SVVLQAGNLVFRTALDYDSEAHSYHVEVTVSDGVPTTPQTITLSLPDALPISPVITTNGGGATAAVSVAENSTAITTVTASDANAGAPLTYSITADADAAKFSINASTGALSFVSAPNFESPTDAGGNNVYDVTV